MFAEIGSPGRRGGAGAPTLGKRSRGPRSGGGQVPVLDRRRL